MADEPMTLIERLLNPAWETDDTGMQRLNVEQTVATMEEAATRIEELEASIARKSGLGVAENRPETFNELKKKQ